MDDSQYSPRQGDRQPGQRLNNSEAAFGWRVDDWTQLERFLILGTEGGTYYVDERDLTRRTVAALDRCIRADATRVLDLVRDVSVRNRAPKVDQAIFALAKVLSARDIAPALRTRAADMMPDIVRTGTHLFQFVHFAKTLRGGGRALKRAVANWYNRVDLPYQITKYPGRKVYGKDWDHQKVFNLYHPPIGARSRENPDDPWEPQDVIAWLRGRKPGDAKGGYRLHGLPAYTRAHIEAQRIEDPRALAAHIRKTRITRESVPASLIANPDVQMALLETMPLAAMLRNLVSMGRSGLLDANSAEAARLVIDKLADGDALRRARVHPVAILQALRMYQQAPAPPLWPRRTSHRNRRSDFPTLSRIVDALDDAFDASFAHIEPTGRRWLLALDVSESMDQAVHGIRNLSCREAAAVMAMVTMRTEQAWDIGVFADRWRIIDLSPRMRLDEVVRRISDLDFGFTDCALPMAYATDKCLRYDAFAVYTDSETNQDESLAPDAALRRYRNVSRLNAKLIVVGMAANDFSIADPADAGMMDVVGFDAAAPAVMADFVRG